MNLPGRANMKVPLEVWPLVGMGFEVAPLLVLPGALISCCVKSPRAAWTCDTNAFNCSVPLANACDANSIVAEKIAAPNALVRGFPVNCFIVMFSIWTRASLRVARRRQDFAVAVRRHRRHESRVFHL